jgi:hypothetical protein
VKKLGIYVEGALDGLREGSPGEVDGESGGGTDVHRSDPAKWKRGGRGVNSRKERGKGRGTVEGGKRTKREKVGKEKGTDGVRGRKKKSRPRGKLNGVWTCDLRNCTINTAHTHTHTHTHIYIYIYSSTFLLQWYMVFVFQIKERKKQR